MGLTVILCCPGDIARQVQGTGKLIEQGGVITFFQQRLVGVLAVDINEQFTQCFELGERYQCAIYVATGATFTGDHPAQNALSLGLVQVIPLL